MRCLWWLDCIIAQFFALPCIHALCHETLQFLSPQRWCLLPHPLSLDWPLDWLCPIKWGRSDNVAVLSQRFRGFLCCMFPFAILEILALPWISKLAFRGMRTMGKSKVTLVISANSKPAPKHGIEPLRFCGYLLHSVVIAIYNWYWVLPVYITSHQCLQWAVMFSSNGVWLQNSINTCTWKKGNPCLRRAPVWAQKSEQE